MESILPKRDLVMAVVIVIAVSTLIGGMLSFTFAQASDPSLPHLVQENGRHALIVDGEPFLILGAQC
ncbi:MAG TPA: beta-galactosidase, partial [bacterium]|nr:beta-galactosidase [bacterium]